MLELKSFSEMVREARARRGFDLRALARAARCSESYVSLIEGGKRLPSEGQALRLARALGIDPTALLLALLRSRLGADGQAALEPESLVREPALQFAVARDFLCRHFEAVVEEVASRVEIEWSGAATVARAYRGFRPLRAGTPVKELAVSEPLGEEADGPSAGALSKPRILESPPGLHFEYACLAAGRELRHVFAFPDGWTPGRGEALSFETRQRLGQAYEMDIQTTLAARGAGASGSRLKRNQALHWCFARHVPGRIDRLAIEVVFPRGYRPLEPTAWAWMGGEPLADQSSNLISRGTCRSHRFRFEGAEARLEVDQPLPFYSFAIAWMPMERAERIEASHRALAADGGRPG